LVLGLLTGLLLVAFAQRADGQFGFLPLHLPDLEVVVNVPVQIQPSQQAFVDIRVNNLLYPLTPPQGPGTGTPLGGAAVNGVFVVVKFAGPGFQPLAVQANGGLQCGLTGSSGTVPPHSVVCTGGAIAAGSGAVISVSVKEIGNCFTVKCGPVYTDAWVNPDNAIAELSDTNNRDVGGDERL
jgi:hypothetical protein